ncbi:tail spike protein [Arthrobacter phage 1191A]|nr:tail spike protein [Arthrobacter phage 1191A]
MAMAHFDVSLAYDQIVKRGVPGQVARVSDADTDLPYVELLDLDGNPLAALVSNSQGYVPPFQIQDGPALVKMSVGGVTYYLQDLNLFGGTAQAAQQAAADAQKAAGLVEAPADEVVATLVQGDTLTQTAGDARWVTNAGADAKVAGLVGGADQTAAALAVKFGAPLSIPLRGKNFSDPPSSYPMGSSFALVDPVNGWPSLPADSTEVVQLTTMKNKDRDGGIVQWLSAFNDDTQPMLWRVSKSDNTWGAFKELVIDDGTSLIRDGNEGIVYTAKHGAAGATVGDGVNNDYWTIQRAINAGKEVILEGGKTYFIGGTLSVPANRDSVSIRGVGSEPPILKIGASGQSYSAIKFERPFSSAVATKTLAYDVGVNFRYWSVADTTGIEPGMLCEVVSSQLWYHDPRPGVGEARKSELHRVQSVQGTRIYMDDPANDGYDVSEETVTLYFYKPIKVHLENLTVMGTLPAVAEETGAVEGIIIDRADQPYIKDVNVINCARTGIRVSKSYAPIVEGGFTRGSNNYYNGYGVSIAGCANAVVRGRSTYESRRAVDVTSSQIEPNSMRGSIISRQTVIEGCKAFGGGFNSRGIAYGWNQDNSFGDYQGGFGSHGGSDVLICRSNEVYDMHASFSVRGRTTIIHDNLIAGRGTGGTIQAAHGTHLYVTNNRVLNGFYSLKPYFSYTPGVSVNVNQIDSLVTLYATWAGNPPTGSQRGQLVITGNEVEARTALIRMHQVPFGEVHIANNRVRLTPPVLTTDVYMIDNQTGAAPSSGVLSRWFIGGNVLAKGAGHSGALALANFPLTGANVLNYTVSP